MPSLQIARALVDRGHAADSIELYGSRRGQEAATWPTLEFPHTLLPGRGLRRSMRPSAWWANAGAVLGLAWACLRATGSFLRRRPRVVVIVGGYASFPAGVAAVVTRAPLVCMNTDAVPGAVNHLLGRFAVANAVAFAETDLPRAHVTGTPVRPELATLDRTPEGRARSRESLGLPPDRQTVACAGGSLGAHRINRAVADLAAAWAACGDRALYHVTGRRDYEEFARDVSGRSDSAEVAWDGTEGRALRYRVVPFEDRMPDLYNAADVCVVRAGAMTVAELLVSGVPAIVVPLPGAPGDHQTRNAEALVGVGAAVIIADRDCDGRRLALELECPPGRYRAAGGHAPSGTGARAPRRGGPRRRTGGRPCPLTATAGAQAMASASASAGTLDLGEPQRIHIVGIGGAGMSAIALVLRAMGHRVTGSDLKDSPVAERLRSHGITVAVGHASDHVVGADAVTYSPAVQPENAELTEARARGIRVVPRSEMLAAICATRRCLAVSGTHGKTTTASMLSLILVEAGMRPSFVIGADVNEIGTNAVWDSGEWLVVEADESYGTFQAIRPDLAVLTSVEADHLDFYGTFEVLRGAFADFLAGASLGSVVCADDPEAAAIGRQYGAATVGSDPGSTYVMADLTLQRSSVSFALRGPEGDLGAVHIGVPGLHNARNAATAVVAALQVGAPFAAAQAALARFAGVTRRFEFRGEAAGVTFVDDYAHLPSEVRAALATARTGGWDRVVAVFQPHRFSRTAALATEFGGAFAEADVLVVTDVYSAGERPVPGVSGRLVADAVRAQDPRLPVTYAAGWEELRQAVGAELRSGDLCLTLGAGDLTRLPDELLESPQW